VSGWLLKGNLLILSVREIRLETFTLVQMLWLEGVVGRGSCEVSVEFVWAGFLRKVLSFSCSLSACFVSTNHNQTVVCSLL
jgi:hypothetical protein